MIPVATPTSLGEGGAAEGALERTGHGTSTESPHPVPVRWTAAAEARLEKVPAFVRPMAQAGIERFARDRGVLEVDEQMLDEAREFFGM
jgi:hypothetical protein